MLHLGAQGYALTHVLQPLVPLWYIVCVCVVCVCVVYVCGRACVRVVPACVHSVRVQLACVYVVCVWRVVSVHLCSVLACVYNVCICLYQIVCTLFINELCA